MSKQPWSEAEDKVLRELWMEQSASLIGERLGRPRRSVIGRAHRLKLSAKKKNAPQQKKVEATRKAVRKFEKAERPKTAVRPAPKMVVEFRPTVAVLNLNCEPVTLDFLTNETCRWPLADDPEFSFCGHPSADLAKDRPYCALHASIAYGRGTRSERSASKLPMSERMAEHRAEAAE